MTVTGVRWAESVNRKREQGEVVIHGYNHLGEELKDSFRVSPRHGGLILTNDNDDSRRLVEQCYKRHKTTVNPIIDWTDADVWTFIRKNNIPYCSLYDEGYHRLGCIGCPMARTKGRERDFTRWPKYKDSYLRAFDKMIEIKKTKQRYFRPYGEDIKDATAQDVFNWWMEYDIFPGQYNLFEDYEDEEEE